MKDLILAQALTNIDNELYCYSNEFPNRLFDLLTMLKANVIQPEVPYVYDLHKLISNLSS